VPKRARRVLPEAAAEEMGAIADVLAALAHGGDPQVAWQSVEEALRRAYRISWDAARQSPEPDEDQVVTLAEVTATRLRSAREAAGLTQAEMAGVMQKLGYAWRRITVAEVEGGTRRVALEELIGLSALYGVPVLAFVLPTQSQFVRIPPHGGALVWPQHIVELFLGQDGVLGHGGTSLNAARVVAGCAPGVPDWRPAQRLWANPTWRPSLSGDGEHRD
jgi:transcriptional regulator with XRE-family HTH domain